MLKVAILDDYQNVSQEFVDLKKYLHQRWNNFFEGKKFLVYKINNKSTLNILSFFNKSYWITINT